MILVTIDDLVGTEKCTELVGAKMKNSENDKMLMSSVWLIHGVMLFSLVVNFSN